jgi:hypothetical protein
MVYSNISHLNNITPLQINNTIIQSSNIFSASLSYMNSMLDYWIVLVSFCLFIGIFYMILTQNYMQLDVPRAILFSSSIIMILNFIMLLSGWLANIYGLSIFSMIFIISLVWIWYVKQGE